VVLQPTANALGLAKSCVDALRRPRLCRHDWMTPMGMDLTMMRTPDTIPKGRPKILRDYPGYFRGVPRDAIDAAGVLDYDAGLPGGPDWPPAGMTQARAEELLLLFDEPTDDDPDTSVMEVSPTYRELRQMQRYVDADSRTRATRSRKQGRVPWFKFASNDGWHVTPEECLIITCRLRALFEVDEEGILQEEAEDFAVFNELAARNGGYEVW